ncbi:sugar-specific transcriptional regulator, TrmB family [Leptospira ryugenii]|uniref:Sugar-specific transcriptional regulator, TrmB family n=2 Tax=Leptospira ryugenii TaxID=1917863 RepID=A0A2P2E2W9_9LEPT|nr:sugar-specific transcriptional regulator, TrmB family [Leptospira ryugenii]
MLKPCGLRITQFTVLASIAYEENQSITDLSRVTDIDRTTLQRSLEILKRDGLILMEKKISGNVSCLSLTKKGEQLLTKGIELWRKAQDGITELMGKTEFKQVLKMLSDVRKLPNLQEEN